ncbi:MAG TPA: hypothetical protein VJ488_03290 [Dehalococcoidia bacterium]|nr:hypothetical protein [Dehalococcoidia bacterium]
MVSKMANIIGKDRKLRTLFSGMVGSVIALLSLIIVTGIFYL